MKDQMIFNLARTMLAKNPQAANSPLGKELAGILESGDTARGQEIANNLCQTYGAKKEDAIQKACGFFGLR